MEAALNWVTSAICPFCPLAGTAARVRRGECQLPAEWRSDLPAGLQDIKAAIRWLRANQQEYHLDGNRIAAWGGSAGGYYAAMVCLTGNVPELET